MRKILVLGAGFSTPFLIRYLLRNAQDLDATVTVADLDLDAARRRIDGHDRGRAISLDFSQPDSTAHELADADLVVNLLPPKLQPEVARLCVENRCHMVSASYRFRQLDELEPQARERGVAILTEMGLDPGIDLMSAQRIIEGVQRRGGVVTRFLSYGGGLPEPTFGGNPLRYCITWNPRNVAMAAEHGAQFLHEGRIRMQPWHRVFDSTWTVDVPGLGPMDAYANRDSIAYRTIHGIDQVHTLVRGTLRHSGYCQAWNLLVRLGLPNEHLHVPRLAQRTWAELVEMFLPDGLPGSSTRDRAARFLGLADDDEHLATLDAIGLFAEEPIGDLETRLTGESPTDALVALLKERLPLPSDTRDMVVLHHELEAAFYVGGGSAPQREKILSTFVHFGERAGITAMATTVGFPAALGARMLLDGRLERRGCLSPTDPDVFEPVLDALEAEGLRFEETVEVLGEPA